MGISEITKYRQIEPYLFELALINCLSTVDSTTTYIRGEMLRSQKISASMQQVRVHLNRLANSQIIVKSQDSGLNVSYWRKQQALGENIMDRIIQVKKIKCHRCSWIGTWAGTVNKKAARVVDSYKVCPSCECKTFVDHIELQLEKAAQESEVYS
jgi:hypothetical protein